VAQKAVTDKMSVSERLLRLKDKLLDSMRLVRLPENLRPFRIREGVILESEEIEVSVPANLVHWSVGDVERQSPYRSDFGPTVARTCDWFKGGPADLDECLAYRKVSIYGRMGSSFALPSNGHMMEFNEWNAEPDTLGWWAQSSGFLDTEEDFGSEEEEEEDSDGESFMDWTAATTEDERRR